MSVSCIICHEVINFCYEEISVLSCGHLYHKKCLQKWIDAKSTCPECRSEITANNYVQKIYPSKNENAQLVYEGSCDETKSIVKVYEESTKNLQKMFIERIVSLENSNSKLTDDLKKCSSEKDLAKFKVFKLSKILNRIAEKNDVFEKEILSLKLVFEKLKNHAKEINGLEVNDKKLNSKLSSVLKLILDESSSNSNGEESFIASMLLLHIKFGIKD